MYIYIHAEGSKEDLLACMWTELHKSWEIIKILGEDLKKFKVNDCHYHFPATALRVTRKDHIEELPPKDIKDDEVEVDEMSSILS